MLEKCYNFQRFITSAGESQWCKEVLKPVNCGGFSDNCNFPASFKSIRGISREQITFPLGLPTLKELKEQLKKSWEERS